MDGVPGRAIERLHADDVVEHPAPDIQRGHQGIDRFALIPPVRCCSDAE